MAPTTAEDSLPWRADFLGDSSFVVGGASSGLGRAVAEHLVPWAERRLALATRFTPQPVDFPEWVGCAPAQLWSELPQRILREALLTRRPVPLLQNGPV